MRRPRASCGRRPVSRASLACGAAVIHAGSRGVVELIHGRSSRDERHDIGISFARLSRGLRCRTSAWRPESVDDRLRVILAIPHVLLAGGVGLGFGWWWSGGVLGAVAGVMALIAWFALVFAATHHRGLSDSPRSTYVGERDPCRTSCSSATNTHRLATRPIRPRSPSSGPPAAETAFPSGYESSMSSRT